LPRKLCGLVKDGSDIDFAIAIVPDRVHTHLSLFFDRTIDAIQQGAHQANWIFDRSTMPWDNQEHPESTDFRIRLLQEQYQQDKEDLPGLMIFRPAQPEPPDSRKCLFVFVVGETPTGGVRKSQFTTALNLIEVADEQKKTALNQKKVLRIIGPTFSGSMYSLAHLLQDKSLPRQFRNIVIRSGTVSSFDTTQWFLKQLPDTVPTVDFASFQQSDRYMLRKFVEFEKDRGYNPAGIAVLAEDETA